MRTRWSVTRAWIKYTWEVARRQIRTRKRGSRGWYRNQLRMWWRSMKDFTP